MIEFLSLHPELIAALVIFLASLGTLLIQLAQVKSHLQQIHIIVNDRTDRLMQEIDQLKQELHKQQFARMKALLDND